MQALQLRGFLPGQLMPVSRSRAFTKDRRSFRSAGEYATPTVHAGLFQSLAPGQNMLVNAVH
jgi:hypothetical protein